MRTVAPVNPLLTVDAVKSHCRIDTTADDALIGMYVLAATEHCEQDCGRSFLTQTWQYSVERFDHHIHIPQWVGATIPYYWDLAPQKRVMFLLRPPLQDVVSIQYTDENGDQQTLDPSQYTVDTTGLFGSVRPAPNCQWARTQMDNPAAVVVTYVAGYGDTPASVPASAQMATLLLAAHMYEHREPVITGTIVSSMPMGIREWLDPIRVLEG
jgi:uncharacterized phiE125 gp8 family phage protein